MTTLTWNSPTWWRTPEQQLERARQLWPNAVLPEPPKEFAPRTNSEVLLFHVPDTFDSFWSKVVAPEGYTKYLGDRVEANMQSLHLAPYKVEFTEPVWLAFDPERGKSERPDTFWVQADIAASEVFSALIQFPEWPLAWYKGASAPCLSGYQFRCGYLKTSLVPSLFRRDNPRQLKLIDVWTYMQNGCWSSPSVREC